MRRDHQLDLRGLIKLPALGRGVRLYASPLDDENYIYLLRVSLVFGQFAESLTKPDQPGVCDHVNLKTLVQNADG